MYISEIKIYRQHEKNMGQLYISKCGLKNSGVTIKKMGLLYILKCGWKNSGGTVGDWNKGLFMIAMLNMY